MNIDVAKLNPLPAGFGRCGSCAYRDTGSPAICFACFRAATRAPDSRACRDCGRPDLAFGQCANPYCSRHRWYDRNVTISYREGVLHNRMNAYKFVDAKGWGLIFARVLLGYLNANAVHFQDYDLIVASPSYPPARQAESGTGFIIHTAAKIDQHRWPFDVGKPSAIVKNQATTPMKNKRWRQREEIAETELGPALAVPDRRKTQGLRVLAFDDLYTTGHTLNQVARCLIESGGARQVTGLSLARQLHSDG